MIIQSILPGGRGPIQSAAPSVTGVIFLTGFAVWGADRRPVG